MEGKGKAEREGGGREGGVREGRNLYTTVIVSLHVHCRWHEVNSQSIISHHCQLL